MRRVVIGAAGGTIDVAAFSDLWNNSDDSDKVLARRVLEDRYTWLEEGILDPSIEGPWIAPDAGGKSKENLHRKIPQA